MTCSSNASPWVTDVSISMVTSLALCRGSSKLFAQGGEAELVGRFALGHNEGLWECLKRIMKLEGDVSDTV